MTAAKAASAPKATKAAKAAPKPAAKKVVKEKAAKPAAAKRGSPVAHGVGRRKAAVARVWLRRNGTGLFVVNDKPVGEYFNTEVSRRSAQIPLSIVPAIASRYDIEVNVFGGGMHGQADAVRLAVSRALVEADETARPALKEQGFLKVDSRKVERKKYGQKKARRKFQFVKR